VSNQTDKLQTVTLRTALSSWNKRPWDYPELPDTAATIPPRSTERIDFGPVTWGLGSHSYWWPNIPFEEDYKAQLHYLNLTMIQDGRRLHSLRQRFGFVEHAEGEYYYTINGVRVDMAGDGTCESQMIHDAYSRLPGFLPPVESGPSASGGCPETWRKFMRIGIRGNRVCQSTPTRYMLEAADETGFLLIPETGIRGNHNQAWHDEYMPQAVEEMILHARNHPSVARYSLSSETLFYNIEASYGWENKHHRMLIDTALEADPTRPLVIETSQGYGHVTSVVNGEAFDPSSPTQHRRLDSEKGHAYLTHHYQSYPKPARTIAQLGEVVWATEGLEPFAVMARDLRLNDICYFAPWSWLNYWPNFIDGSNHANFGWLTNNHPDRKDNVDGWGSLQVEFCRKSLHPYLVMDIGLEKLNRTFSHPWPKSTVSYKPGAEVIRRLEVFNNGLFGNRMQLRWSARWDKPEAELIASGQTDPFTLKPGFHTTKTVSFTLPEVIDSERKPFYLVIESCLDGMPVFKETALRFECDRSTVDPQARFVGIDGKTQGNYEGKYGKAGHLILQAPEEGMLPGDVKLNWIRNGTPYVWAAKTEDVRALPYFINDHITNNRIAACRYGDEIEFVIDSGSKPRQLALYFLDWGGQDHAVEIEVTAGDVVSNQLAEDFTDGVYHIWTIQGRVNIRLTKKTRNAVISGLFFD